MFNFVSHNRFFIFGSRLIRFVIVGLTNLIVGSCSRPCSYSRCIECLLFLLGVQTKVREMGKIVVMDMIRTADTLDLDNMMKWDMC